MSSQVAKLCPMFLLMVVSRGRWEAQRSRLASLRLHAFPLIRGSLRAKFILVIVALQIAVMGAVAVVMERHQRNAIIEPGTAARPIPRNESGRCQRGISAQL